MTKKTAYYLKPKVSSDKLSQLSDRVILIRRISKVTAGGKTLRFNALVAVGDGHGVIGLGLGKAAAVPDAVRKGEADARNNLILVPLDGTTLPHEIIAKFSASFVLLKPAVLGTGVVAGSTVRAIMELVGIKDILTKSKGNPNPINLAMATLEALSLIRDPKTAIEYRKKFSFVE
jgi:small subunit ribosomal protein S5